jgi:hypothetical protein
MAVYIPYFHVFRGRRTWKLGFFKPTIGDAFSICRPFSLTVFPQLLKIFNYINVTFSFVDTVYRYYSATEIISITGSILTQNGGKTGSNDKKMSLRNVSISVYVAVNNFQDQTVLINYETIKI